MAILKVSRMGHPVLRQPAREIPADRVDHPALQRLIDDMVETMADEQGIGLAAPQVFQSLRLFAALMRIGWRIKRQADGSHRVLSRPGWSAVVFAFHDSEEIGPRMLARLAKKTGLKPEDL